MDEGFWSYLNFDFWSFLDIAGSNPFAAMWYLFIHGGWIVILIALLWAAKYGWLYHIQRKTGMAKEWVLLRIQVPKISEQTPKAAENMFASFAGAHSPPTWTDKWIRGATQSPISLELVSLDGQVAFYIRSERRMRDLVEAAIYAQYPDAQIAEADDYAMRVPAAYPDEEWDAFGTEMIPVKADPYPLKTYFEFEDKVSGEFKDPVANLLEVFSRLGPGEQAWYQILISPTDQKDAGVRAEKLINKIKGVEEKPKKTMLDHLIDIPIGAVQDVGSVFLGSTETPVKKDDKNPFGKMLNLSPGERGVLEAIERKASKIGFMSKIRFLYVAKKTVMSKPRIVNPFIGAIKQTNTFNMQSLKPEGKRIGVNSALWFFKDRRNNARKTSLVNAYRYRSGWVGSKSFLLSAEELATLWHFPILLQVKSAALHKIEAKKSAAPSNLPFA